MTYGVEVEGGRQTGLVVLRRRGTRAPESAGGQIPKAATRGGRAPSLVPETPWHS